MHQIFNYFVAVASVIQKGPKIGISVAEIRISKASVTGCKTTAYKDGMRELGESYIVGSYRKKYLKGLAGDSLGCSMRCGLVFIYQARKRG